MRVLSSRHQPTQSGFHVSFSLFQPYFPKSNQFCKTSRSWLPVCFMFRPHSKENVFFCIWIHVHFHFIPIQTTNFKLFFFELFTRIFDWQKTTKEVYSHSFFSGKIQRPSKTFLPVFFLLGHLFVIGSTSSTLLALSPSF